MTSEKRGDLIINGIGTFNGGSFEQVLISGKGTVNGPLDCAFFKCNGTGVVNGDLKSDKSKISGNAKIHGKVSSSDAIVEGRATIHGDVNAHKLIIRGTATFEGSMKGEKVVIQGKLGIGGDCEVESFKSEGQFTVGGLLSAEKIDITMAGECRATEIGGETIRVRQKTNLFRDLVKAIFPIVLEVDLIEGDYIELENTKAKMVRGNHIIIGENCAIDAVEYKEFFQQDKNSTVKTNIQL